MPSLQQPTAHTLPPPAAVAGEPGSSGPLPAGRAVDMSGGASVALVLRRPVSEADHCVSLYPYTGKNLTLTFVQLCV